MQTLPSVAICFPSADFVHAEFALALAGLCNSTRPLVTPLINVKSSIIAVARNNGVERAQQLGVDYILFLDSDMSFPRSTLHRLLAHRRDIVGATYVKRVPPYDVLGLRLHEGEIDGEGDLIEMRHLPTGCLLISMKVFEALPKPYFRFRVDEEAETIVGEDYDFCDRVRERGFRLWCDAKLSWEMEHIGVRGYRIESKSNAEVI